MHKSTLTLTAKILARYSNIYQGIDVIVKRAVAELVKTDEYFTYVKIRRTGSSISGVKVGLPHESDYVMELPKDKQLKTKCSFDSGTLFPLIQNVVDTQAVALTKGCPALSNGGKVEVREIMPTEDLPNG